MLQRGEKLLAAPEKNMGFFYAKIFDADLFLLYKYHQPFYFILCIYSILRERTGFRP